MPAKIIILIKLNAAASITMISSPVISLVVIAGEMLIFFQMTDPPRGIRGIYISNIRKFADITKANINGLRCYFAEVVGSVSNKQWNFFFYCCPVKFLYQNLPTIFFTSFYLFYRCRPRIYRIFQFNITINR